MSHPYFRVSTCPKEGKLAGLPVWGLSCRGVERVCCDKLRVCVTTEKEFQLCSKLSHMPNSKNLQENENGIEKRAFRAHKLTPLAEAHNITHSME